MKNSTRKNSSKVVKCKNIGGLVFFQKIPGLIIGVDTWITKGCPDNCYIHDSLLNLALYKIPMLDALPFKGYYIKQPLAPRQPWEGKVKKPKKLRKFFNVAKLETVQSKFIKAHEGQKIGTREIMC